MPGAFAEHSGEIGGNAGFFGNDQGLHEGIAGRSRDDARRERLRTRQVDRTKQTGRLYPTALNLDGVRAGASSPK